MKNIHGTEKYIQCHNGRAWAPNELEQLNAHALKARVQEKIVNTLEECFTDIYSDILVLNKRPDKDWMTVAMCIGWSETVETDVDKTDKQEL